MASRPSPAASIRYLSLPHDENRLVSLRFARLIDSATDRKHPVFMMTADSVALCTRKLVRLETHHIPSERISSLLALSESVNRAQRSSLADGS